MGYDSITFIITLCSKIQRIYILINLQKLKQFLIIQKITIQKQKEKLKLIKQLTVLPENLKVCYKDV